jgi:hypothetical protein
MENIPLFVVDPDPVVVWPVIVALPVDGGQFKDFSFDAHIRVMSPDEYAELTKGDSDTTPKPLEAVLQENARLFPFMITGWNKVNDPAGNPILFTPLALTRLITGPHGGPLSVGIWKAIHEIRNGVRLGNSEPPSSTG